MLFYETERRWHALASKDSGEEKTEEQHQAQPWVRSQTVHRKSDQEFAAAVRFQRL